MRETLYSCRRALIGRRWTAHAANPRPILWLFALAILALLLQATGDLSAATLPAGFIETSIDGTFDDFAGVTFDAIGSVYAWDRLGRVWLVENDVKLPTPVLDISEEVGGYHDHGMLGVTLDPNFRQNGYIYLLYVVDHHYLFNYGTTNYSSTVNEYFKDTIGRLTRYTARASDNFHTVDPASRKVLLGETRSTGFPMTWQTHAVGSLVFGADGTLLASCGDGGGLSDAGSSPETWYIDSLNDGIIRPKENVGAFRAQMVDSLSGKVVRLDPATGNGVSSNPFYESANPRAPHSRVWSLGLRNPCRMSLRAGSGSANPADGNPGVLYIGDVGYFTWEELSVCTGPAQNFGWPIFEGYDRSSSYSDVNPANQDAPNPLFGSGGCTQQYFTFKDLLQEATLGTPSWPNPCNAAQQVPGSIPHFVHTRPVMDWNHAGTPSRTGIFNGNNAAVINIGASGAPVSGPQFGGNCSIGGAWYEGNSFPPQYKHTYFHADLSGWIHNVTFDATDKPVSVRNFASNAGSVVFVAVHPINGALYYISWTDALRKITYIGGGNQPPRAVASSDLNYGPGPLTVQFTGSASSDPEGLPLTYRWDFGDATAASTSVNPSHTFSAPAGTPTRYDVTLTVTDNAGATNTTKLLISVNNTPPLVTILTPTNGTPYSVATQAVYSLTALVSDNEQSQSQLSPQWQTFLHHNTHFHNDPIDTNWNTTTVISPLGCDVDTYYYQIILTVTDSAGLSTTASVNLYPDCANNTPPTISTIADQSIPPNGTTGALPFIINDLQTAPSGLILSASSSNPALVPTNNIFFGGSETNRTVRVTAVSNQTGSAVIGIFVSDGFLTSSNGFVVNVNTVNQPPTISSIPDQTITTNSSLGPINFTIGDVETAASSLVVTASSSNTGLVPNSSIVLGGSASNRTVSVTPVANQAGSTTITIQVSDGALAASTTFGLAVTAPNSSSWLLSEGFEGPGFENSGWQKTGSPNEDYTTVVLHGSQSLHCVGEQYIERPFRFSNRFYLYCRVRWLAMGGFNNIIYWDDVNYDIVASLDLGGAGAIELGHGTVGARGSTAISLNTTYHLWIEWTKGTGANGTMKLFVSRDANKPAFPEATIQTGTGGPTERIYVGSTSSGEDMIFDRILVDSVEIGSNPGDNLPPSISVISDQVTSEDTPIGPISFTVGDSQTSATNLTLAASSSNPSLLPNSNIVFGGTSSNRTVTLSPAPDQFGTATVTLSVSDGSLIATRAFLLSVNAVNDPPTISTIADQMTDEDTIVGPLTFTISDPETGSADLPLSASSSNPLLVPNGNILIGGSASNRTLRIFPATNQFGTATISVTVSDGSATVDSTFLLTVRPVNDPPTISAITGQTVDEDTLLGPLTFSIADVETAAADLTLSASSSNPLLVPTANILFGGSDSNRTVTILPATNQFGATTITLSVSDGSAAADSTLLLTVRPINDPPTISAIADQTVDEDTLSGPLTFSIGDVETAAADLTLSASSSNPLLVPTANILFGGSDSNRTVTILPATNQFGVATITLSVTDGSATANSTFVLTVRPINDPPNISAIGDQTIDEDTSVGPLTFIIGDVETVAGDLTLSASSSNPVLVPNGNIVFGGSESNRTVTILPATNQFGTTRITLAVTDGENSVSNSFVLAVRAVNDPPSISSVPDQVGREDTTQLVDFVIGDVETSAADLTLTGSSSNPLLVPNSNIIFAGSDSNRTVRLIPAGNQSGETVITISVSDGEATATDTFLLTVRPVNDPPTISDIADQFTDEDTPLGPLSFTVGDADMEATDLTPTGSSSDPRLVPYGNIIFGGSDSNRTITIIPATNQFGTVNISIGLTDGEIDTLTMFKLTINPINDPPTLDPLPDLAIAQNSSPRVVPLTGITPGPSNEVQNLTITAVSSNPDLIPSPTLTYSSPEASGTLTLAPVPDAVGNSLITVSVTDDGGTLTGGHDTTSRSFNVTVFPRPALEIAQDASGLRLTFATVPGKTYLVEYVDALDDTNWTDVDAIPGTGDVLTVPLPASGAPCRFYRVRIE